MSLRDIVDASKARMQAPAPVEIDPAGRSVLLVYLFSGLGDVVLLAPVIRALRARRPSSIGVVVPESGGRILARSGLRMKVHHPGEPLPEYAIAVDLTHRSGEPEAREIAMRAGVRLGWIDHPGEAHGLDHGTIDVRPLADRHWSRACALPLAPLGVREPDYDVPWSATPAARRWAEAQWAPGPRVLLVPGGRSADKQWVGWRDVVPALVERHRASVLLAGAPWEAAAIAAWGLGRMYTGRDLSKLVALIASADLVLASDTGPMHLAFALRIPTVALFLRMAPESWGPPRPDPRFAVTRVPETADPAAIARWVIDEASARLSAARGARPRPTRAR